MNDAATFLISSVEVFRKMSWPLCRRGDPEASRAEDDGILSGILRRVSTLLSCWLYDTVEDSQSTYHVASEKRREERD